MVVVKIIAFILPVEMFAHYVARDIQINSFDVYSLASISSVKDVITSQKNAYILVANKQTMQKLFENNTKMMINKLNLIQN